MKLNEGPFRKFRHVCPHETVRLHVNIHLKVALLGTISKTQITRNGWHD